VQKRQSSVPSRRSNFIDSFPTGGRLPKNLRLNAREFGDYMSGRDGEEVMKERQEPAITRQKYGKSSGTNN
jgi:hypothetical protein